jgi:uncharacterized protein YkwD
MSNILRSLTALLFILLLASCSIFYRPEREVVVYRVPESPRTTPVPPRPSDTPALAEAAEMLTLVNEARARGGVCGSVSYPASSPLRYDAVLERAARKHSEDMNAAMEMGHISPVGGIHNPAGSVLRDRINREGYAWSVIGENVSWNYLVVSELVAAWLDSPHHCENILNPEFTEVGFGKAGTYWTQNFGRPM